VTGTSIGRGFAGVMARHNFKGQRATHGVKKVHRCGGSFGCRTFPGRVFKGNRMPGQLGNERSTMRNLLIVRMDLENHLLLLRGAVPGPNGGLVLIRETNKKVRVGQGPARPSKKKK
jgi:large subunit ribosomal protein L3